MWDAIGNFVGTILATAIFIFLVCFVIYIVIRFIATILYFIKLSKMTPVERNNVKRIRKRKRSSDSSDDWLNFDFDSGGSADGGGDGGGGGGD
jgi:uncharacterized membrane protein YgcG